MDGCDIFVFCLSFVGLGLVLTLYTAPCWTVEGLGVWLRHTEGGIYSYYVLNDALTAVRIMLGLALICCLGAVLGWVMVIKKLHPRAPLVVSASNATAALFVLLTFAVFMSDEIPGEASYCLWIGLYTIFMLISNTISVHCLFGFKLKDCNQNRVGVARTNLGVTERNQGNVRRRLSQSLGIRNQGTAANSTAVTQSNTVSSRGGTQSNVSAGTGGTQSNVSSGTDGTQSNVSSGTGGTQSNISSGTGGTQSAATRHTTVTQPREQPVVDNRPRGLDGSTQTTGISVTADITSNAGGSIQPQQEPIAADLPPGLHGITPPMSSQTMPTAPPYLPPPYTEGHTSPNYGTASTQIQANYTNMAFVPIYSDPPPPYSP